MISKSTKDLKIEYRVANSDDSAGILTVLQEVASEIPVSLDGPERQNIIQNIIAECCDSNESWIAVNADGTVVGFVLAKPDRLERFEHENQALSLRYIGVNRTSRQRGIFAALMKKLTAKGVPLTASVLHTNHSAMVDRLVKIGFTKVESDTTEIKLRWPQ
jgi:N-acetylglutamate synthase-like GNAT family acetyltransferase